MTEFIYKSNSPEDTQKLARNLAKIVQKDLVLALKGDLGAGKTLFTKELCYFLGVEEVVTSPTFNLMNIYNGNKTIYHFDLYRLEDESQLDDIGFYEYTDTDDDVIIIEWADNFWENLPDDYLKIEIEKISENDMARIIKISCTGDKYKYIVEEMNM